MNTHALVLSTHILSRKICDHFTRLQTETRLLLDTYLCARKPIKRYDGMTFPVDFSISRRDEKNLVPKRYAEMKRRDGKIIPGFSDLATMPALLSSRLAKYTHVWLVEYDVDFAGSWAEFFTEFRTSSADLVGTTFYPRGECPDWYHWQWFEAPPNVSLSFHVRSFGPVVRFSRRMMNCYIDAMRDGRWLGHNEAIFPTLALYNGLTIQDLGGYGPYTPIQSRGKGYTNTPADKYLSPGTFVFRPVEHRAYFLEAPEQFPMRGYLYHPVKVHDEVVQSDGALAKAARISRKLRKSLFGS